MTYIPVNSEGIVSAAAMIESIRNETVLVTLMLANNEVRYSAQKGAGKGWGLRISHLNSYMLFSHYDR